MDRPSISMFMTSFRSPSISKQSLKLSDNSVLCICITLYGTHFPGLTQQVQTIQTFIQTNDVPENLGQEITQHFDIINKQSSGDATSHNTDVFSMLSHSLQVEVARIISHPLVQHCYVFENCDGNFIDSICVLLREV